MNVELADEVPRTSDDPAFRDAVTFVFGDPAARLYGLARVAVGTEGASAFAVVYAGEAPAGASTQTRVPIQQTPAAWDAVAAAGVRTSVKIPLEAWKVAYDGPEACFELHFEASSAPAVLAPDDPVALAGGMEGYEQMCSVAGCVRHGGRTHGVRCLGQRSRMWGAPDWERIALARTLSAWLGADRGVMLTAVRPSKAKHHDQEALAAFLVDGGEPRRVFDPRLSTTYDADFRQRRAGLELWMEEEGGIARRVAGEALCGSTLDLGDMRLNSAFFLWRMEGREGVGRYDVLRYAGGVDAR